MSYPLRTILEAMEYLNLKTKFDTHGNGIHYERDSDMRLFEVWLHEAGHMLSLEKKFVHYPYNGSSIIGNRLQAPYGTRSEIRALSVEILAARMLGHPLTEDKIIEDAVFHRRIPKKQLKKLVYRQVKCCATTRRYARLIVNQITNMIRSFRAEEL